MLQGRCLESPRVLRIGNLLVPGELHKFSAASRPPSLDQFGVAVIGEVEKRRGLAIFLSHEKKRNKRRKQSRAGGKLLLFVIDELAQTLAPGPVSDLIVILTADHERRSREIFGEIAVAPFSKP